jgi:molybdopterin molybdotransferase
MTLLSLDEALARLLAGVAPLEAETLPLERCGGATLAADLVADRDQPPEAMSAMDGYAVREADSAAGASLAVIGEAPAGAPFQGRVEPGTAVRIATGGVVPEGAERIVIQENVEREGGRIRIVVPAGAATFVRPAGGDFAAGQVLAEAGERLTPARLGLAAAANRDRLEVRRKPRVALLASGDELREPGGALAPGEVVNSAVYALAELVSAWGGIAIRHPILSDDRAQCLEQLGGDALDADLILPLGGASVGERDILRPVLQSLGAEIRFEKIAVQPGKPCWHARFPDGRLVLGLPGNPASAFVCAHLLLKPLLLALLGNTEPDRPLRAALTRGLPGGGDREVYWRARLSADEAGQLRVTPDERQDSGLQTPLAAANALIRRLPGAKAAAADDLVEVLAIGPLA